MNPFRRKTRLEKVVDAARDAQLPSGVKSALDDVRPPEKVKSGVAAVAATIAASAAISALRRRIEGTGER
jgi:hypothetical protein